MTRRDIRMLCWTIYGLLKELVHEDDRCVSRDISTRGKECDLCPDSKGRTYKVLVHRTIYENVPCEGRLRHFAAYVARLSVKNGDCWFTLNFSDGHASIDAPEVLFRTDDYSHNDNDVGPAEVALLMDRLGQIQKHLHAELQKKEPKPLPTEGKGHMKEQYAVLEKF